MPHDLNVPDAATARPAVDPWACTTRFDDIDAQAAHFRGFGQHYEQLGAGPFRGTVESYQFGGELTVNFESTNRELMQAASTPHERLGFSVLAPGSAPCVLNAQLVTDRDVILYPAGTTVEGKTPAGMQIYCVDIAAGSLAGHGVETRDIRVVRDPERSEALRDLLVAGIDAFRRLGGPTAHQAATSHFHASLSEHVWQVASAENPEPTGVRRRGRKAAFRIFHRARERFIAELPVGPSIGAVCREIGVSRRSLEGAFDYVVGVSPAHFIRTLQLNRVRRDLLAPELAGTAIGSLAARHGVWHWSRFSQNYRLMFGELPSETRRRVVVERGR
ncbi:MAG: helix-turn-helix domain-containing protein [Proteobacteria bacterium]|nr:helix-turn-helix domain-containing protein [Pseudomonadota bacterium]